ncbi:MAG: 50S ribosomal protein L3 [gamma proteobacterium symbiont of Bathyaustriella thionipta]|nr:50S ribosomal protein L3 [gamma proteobacterium symbiont of Bathyaustriella thionipta]MCU7949063.1 50S ribosomal protein L3 [gamma proteobacterium symbiont of Bathyaustriella thionipta]MCU7952590.1 50S ribosomal protein L3 [gamma proteobacterium symbiont of Bathyaustriella thionipta]MCU7955670.1 50S ribosomal protein L3 [gamma proteobacterium symbiont of Bathyaustriella thionipta]MCU7967207.1 50S ribosomal protein L3 [gamma proteobacterium symbiont of Bathyaustriella thionipta]
MSLGLVGRKVGMTRIFTEQGESIPVTVLEMEPNRVTQVKTSATDGYNAIQVTVGSRRASRVSKAAAGHFAKAGVEAGRKTVEFRLESETELAAGSEIKADIFEAGQIVDVTGTLIGKGFQGGIKRHNFHRQDMTHGNSISHRSNGSIGQNQTPGRVFKGKKMSGHMGAAKSTIQNIEIVRVDVDKNLILVRGGIPGSKNADVIIKPAVKMQSAGKE